MIQAFVNWEPHWLIQGAVVVLFTWLLKKLYGFFIERIRSWARWFQLRHLRAVRRISNNRYLVIEQIVKTYIFQAIFILSFIIFVFAFLLGPVVLSGSNIFNKHFLLFALPIYVFEIIYLHHASLLKSVYVRATRTGAA